MTTAKRQKASIPTQGVVNLDDGTEAFDRLDGIRIPIDDLDLFPIFPILLPQLSGTYIRRPWVLSPTAEDVAPAFTPGPDGPDDFPHIPGMPDLPIDLPQRFPIDRFKIPFDFIRRSEDLRVDVDGYYPQMVVSGVIRSGLSRRLDWHARVTKTPTGSYTGAIVYRDGDSSLLPQAQVEVSLVRRSRFGRTGSATAVFSGGGASSVARTFSFSTTSFHPLSFEYDTTTDSDAVTTFDTATHPNRPATLATEVVTIEKVFQRAGFDVAKSGGDSSVPVSAAGTDALWTDQELNDAMAVYWSAYKTVPDWAAWALFAGRSIRGSSLGGIMFDYTGATAPQRQGCVVFSNSFISDVPAGPDGAAWVQRMRFWTAVHELGHTFNLLHAWDKPADPWVPTSSEAGLRSFMNYPYSFAGGSTAFFSDFRYSFSDSELLFLRHAPERFVQQGNNAWAVSHGFEQADVIPDSALQLELRAQRESLRYEFLEPVTLELKLKNASGEPVIIDENALDLGRCTILVTKRGGQTVRLDPYAQLCFKPQPKVLAGNESLYGSVTVSSGRDGWAISDPGDYIVQVAVHLPGQDVVSRPLTVRVLPPASHDAEVVAQDIFTPEVGRVLAAGGTRREGSETNALREAATRLGGTAIAKHAAVALGRPLARPGKELVVSADGGAPKAEKFVTHRAHPQAAADEMAPALRDINAAADTFGHIATKKRVEALAQAQADAGHKKEAVATQKNLHDVLADRGVKAEVLKEISATQASLQKG
jgi:hypothetical protein